MHPSLDSEANRLEESMGNRAATNQSTYTRYIRLIILPQRKMGDQKSPQTEPERGETKRSHDHHLVLSLSSRRRTRRRYLLPFFAMTHSRPRRLRVSEASEKQQSAARSWLFSAETIQYLEINARPASVCECR